MRKFSTIAAMPRPKSPKPSYPRLAGAGLAVAIAACSDGSVPDSRIVDELAQGDAASDTSTDPNTGAGGSCSDAVNGNGADCLRDGSVGGSAPVGYGGFSGGGIGGGGSPFDPVPPDEDGGTCEGGSDEDCTDGNADNGDDTEEGIPIGGIAPAPYNDDE